MTIQEILALLTTKFSGVRKDGLEQMARVIALQCANMDEAKALVDKITDAQVNEFVKDYRKIVDTEVSNSNKTFEANLRKKYDFKEKETEPGGDNHDEPKGLAAQIKAAIAEAIAPINSELANYKKKDVANARLQKLNEALKDCKDETFKTQTLKDFSRMSFNDDDAFNEYLTEKGTAIKEANQSKANDDLSQSAGVPLFSQKEESGVSKGVAEFVKSQKPENNTFTGKDI